MSDTSHDYEGVLREKLLDELKAIRELVEDVPEIKERVRRIEDDIADIKADLHVIKLVMRDHSADIAELKAKAA